MLKNSITKIKKIIRLMLVNDYKIGLFTKLKYALNGFSS